MKNKITLNTLLRKDILRTILISILMNMFSKISKRKNKFNDYNTKHEST